MPELDRRLLVIVETESTNSFGESTTITVNYNVWGQLIQDTVARSIDAGGVLALAARSWRVRFNQAFLVAHQAGQTITVVYGSEDPDIVTAVGEWLPRGAPRRRRFLDMVT